jgi:hypothetical protein
MVETTESMTIASVDAALTASIVVAMTIVVLGEIMIIGLLGNVLVIATMMIVDAIEEMTLAHAKTTFFDRNLSHLLHSSIFRRSSSISRDSMEDTLHHLLIARECRQ